MRSSWVLALALLLGCSRGHTRAELAQPVVVVPFARAASGPITVPVRAGEVETRFIVDTGIGIQLVSGSLCRQIGCEPAGTFTGRRMSGQSIEVQLATVSSLSFGGVTQHHVTVGVLDNPAFFPDPAVTGFLSLDFFRRQPFTLDYQAGTLTLETEASLAARVHDGTAVPARIVLEGPTVGIFVPLALPGGAAADVEIDTGSDALILHQRYLDLLPVETATLKRREGVDETGHPYVRTFAKLQGRASPRGSSAGPDGLVVMFQDIIHDGLAGNAFLEGFTTTFDLERRRVVFAPHEPRSGASTRVPNSTP